MIEVKVEDLIFDKKAKKFGLVHAKMVSDVIKDAQVAQHLLLITPEGSQPIRIKNTVLCIGVAKEMWQQDKDGFVKKYQLVDLQDDGWMICVAKSNNVVNVCQILCQIGVDGFKISALWGECDESIKGLYWQKGLNGDYILQDPNKLEDVWIIKKEIFEASYRFVEA